jgi:hypothetical protein
MIRCFSSVARASVDKFFAGSIPTSRLVKVITEVLGKHSFRPETTALAFSFDPFVHSSLDLSCRFTDLSTSSAVNFGGLGGIPFAGKTGWSLFEAQSKLRAKHDLMVVYNVSATVNASGVVEQDSGALEEAFLMVQAANGIEGLSDSLFTDRHDVQMAHILLETARAYDSTVSAHPDQRER